VRTELWIIECRDSDGRLDFTGRQPEFVFGLDACRGMTDDQIAKVIYQYHPTAQLSGDTIPTWPRILDIRWTARRKTW
jgi:hypothetical protein